jgi:hypothetical protein
MMGKPMLHNPSPPNPVVPPTKSKVLVTLITATEPARLTKHFSLRDGALLKSPGGILTRGRAEINELDGLLGLKKLVAALGPNQALTYGLPMFNPATIVTKEEWSRTGRPKSVMPRTKEMFRWNEGPGILMLDYDRPQDGPALEPSPDYSWWVWN